MTNYEKIKSMTVEEMTEFIVNFDTDEFCRCCDEVSAFCFCRGNKCNEAVAEWLNEEVTE